MTPHSISLPNFTMSAEIEPLGRGFQNSGDMTRHVAERTDQFRLGDQEPSAVRSFMNSHQSDVEVSVSHKQISDLFEEHQRHIVAVSDLVVPHNHAPLPKVAREHHITNAEKVTEEFANDSRIRFRAASCTNSAQLDCDTSTNAASSRGELLTALVHAAGAHRILIKLFASHQIPSAINTIAAPIRNFFASCSRSKDSNPQLLRSAAPTAFATMSVVPHSRANAGRRGRV